MAQWTWALIAVILIALVIAIVLIVNRQRRSLTLQRRFGPEYTRAVESADDRRTAEAQLEERARRRAQLTIVPLAEPVRLRYSEEWRALQEQFVDRPADAVAGAENLVTRVMNDRGYPVGEFEQQAELISVDHPHVVDNYRVAHEIHGRTTDGRATTEDLREAMLRYRSLFDDLLHPGQDGHDERAGRDVVPPDAVLGHDEVPRHETQAERDVVHPEAGVARDRVTRARDEVRDDTRQERR